MPVARSNSPRRTSHRSRRKSRRSRQTKRSPRCVFRALGPIQFSNVHVGQLVFVWWDGSWLKGVVKEKTPADVKVRVIGDETKTITVLEANTDMELQERSPQDRIPFSNVYEGQLVSVWWNGSKDEDASFSKQWLSGVVEEKTSAVVKVRVNIGDETKTITVQRANTENDLLERSPPWHFSPERRKRRKGMFGWR